MTSSRWLVELTPRWVVKQQHRRLGKLVLDRLTKHKVSLAFLPHQATDEVLQATSFLTNTCGISVVCHVPARRFENDLELVDFVDNLTQRAGVKDLFIVAGDGEPKGDLKDSMDVLGALQKKKHDKEKIRSIGIAAYPDGHASISDDSITRALHQKLQILETLSLESFHLVTQLSLSKDSVAKWARGLPNVPFYVGVFGPVGFEKITRLSKRLQFGKAMESQVAVLRNQFQDDMYEFSNNLIAAIDQTASRNDFPCEGFQVSTFDDVANTLDWLDLVSNKHLSQVPNS